MDIKSAMKKAKEMAESQGLDYNDRKYLPVKDRLTIFREEFGISFGINTDVHWQDDRVFAAAKITNAEGTVLASGHAMVDTTRDSHTAPVESAETFAIGRALACFGLAGTEYASSNEMERVKQPERPQRPQPEFRDDTPPRVAKTRVMAHGSDDGLSGDQRQFKRDVETAFPAVEDSHGFFIPTDNSPDSLNGIYDQVDRIADRNELSRYYNLVAHELEWMEPEDKQEISAAFRARRDQLKG